MDKFNPVAIIELENFLIDKNIERLKTNFIKRNFCNEDKPENIDYEKGILYHYDSYKNDLVSTKFEDFLKEELWSITNNIKSEIDLSNALLNNKEKTKYWQSISISFDYIKTRNTTVFDLFPVCYKPQETIIEYLQNKYQYDSLSLFEGVSFFTIKPKYTKIDLKKIYTFITEELFLDDEIYSFDDFVSVFFEEKTNQTLVFNCETPVIVNILDNVKLLFTDLTRKRIEESARFLTKPGAKKASKIITVNNYQSSLNRAKKPELTLNIKKVKHFFKNNF
ncbi:hypothetical protein [Polaribacter sp. IC073]|uniref:hypothetical protein n=1 Tax=Polaribacter sp. IC073 TaxID=2508540 RepID=UPI0011BE99CF|nr:hypothetical protein [Polaribacter sp. IC073]TXD47780.1 hypothetical protein ES045_10875 [Polaribacter sp. IC073]